MKNLKESSLPFPVSALKISESEKAACHLIFEKTSGIVARHLNKRFSLPVSIYLARWGVVPNWITLFNLILGIYSGVLASLGTPAALLQAGVLFQIVSVLDGCDGEVAKLNGRSSRWGAWFDTFGDNFSLICFVLGVSLGYYRQTHALWIWHLSIFNSFVLALMFFIMIRYLIKQKNSHPSLVNYEKEVVSQSQLSSGVKKFIASTKYVVKKDVFSLGFCLLAVFNLPQVILIGFSIGILAITLVLLSIQSRNPNSVEMAQANNEAVS